MREPWQPVAAILFFKEGALHPLSAPWPPDCPGFFTPGSNLCVVHASSQSTQNCTGLFGGLFHTDLYAVLPCTTIYCHLVPHLYCMHAAERERCTFVCSQICTLAPHFKSAPLLLLLSSFPCVCFHLLFRKSACYTTLICNLNFFPQLCWPQISCRPSGTLCLCHSAGHAMSPHHHASPRQLASWQHFQLEAAAPPQIGFSTIDFLNWISIWNTKTNTNAKYKYQIQECQVANTDANANNSLMIQLQCHELVSLPSTCRLSQLNCVELKPRAIASIYLPEKKMSKGENIQREKYPKGKNAQREKYPKGKKCPQGKIPRTNEWRIQRGCFLSTSCLCICIC